MTLTYAVVKFIQLYKGENPLITELIEVGHFGATDTLNLNEINFRMAFAVGSASRIKHDPAYVKYLVRYFKKDHSGDVIDRYVPSHDCTAEDLAQFG